MGAVAQQVVVRTLGVDEPGFGDVVRLVDDYRVHYGAQPDRDGTERWLRGTACRARVRCYLATTTTDDVAVGVALVFPSPMTVRLDELWVLRDLYVGSGHRGHGVGRALVTRVRDDARAAGVPRIALQTEADNDAARSLYRSLGFIAPEGVVSLSLAL
jgi:GNAT superfamily N-acetyltransferase